MKVPVIGVDRLAQADLAPIRRALRAEQYSAYEIDGFIIVVSGELERIKTIAWQAARLSMPRARKLEVDGAEIIAAHEDPDQFKRLSENRVAQVHGLEGRARDGLRGLLTERNFFAEIGSDGVLRVQYPLVMQAELNRLVNSYKRSQTRARQMAQPVARRH